MAAKADKLTWFGVENRPGAKIPKWARSGAVSEAGHVFLPAALAGNELSVTLAAAWDGVDLVSDSGHVYVPSEWMAKEYPETQKICSQVEAKARELPRVEENQ